MLVTVTNAKGESELTFPSPGICLLTANLRQDAKDSSRANIDVFIVDLRINETLPMYNQPPKSPLSGGLLRLRGGRSYWYMSPYFVE